MVCPVLLEEFVLRLRKKWTLISYIVWNWARSSRKRDYFFFPFSFHLLMVFIFLISYAFHLRRLSLCYTVVVYPVLFSAVSFLSSSLSFFAAQCSSSFWEAPEFSSSALFWSEYFSSYGKCKTCSPIPFFQLFIPGVIKLEFLYAILGAEWISQPKWQAQTLQGVQW